MFQITPGCQIWKKYNQPRLVVTQGLEFNIRTIEMAKQGSHWHRSNASALPYRDNFHQLFLQHQIIRVNEDVRRFIIIYRTCPLLWRTMLGYLGFWCSNEILNRYYLTSLTFIPIVLLLYGTVFIRFVTPFNYQLIPQFTQFTLEVAV